MIGDETFLLKSYILRLYSDPQILHDDTKKIFNEQLSCARKVVEDAFGQLSLKFRVHQKRLKSLLENSDKIVFTICILYNFINTDNENLFTTSMSGQLTTSTYYKYSKSRRKPTTSSIRNTRKIQTIF